LQALNAWSLTVAGVAGVVAVGAVLLAALTSTHLASTRLAEPSRRIAEAPPGPSLTQRAPASHQGPAPEVQAVAAKIVDIAVPADTRADGDPERLRRRTQAFAALVRSRTPELALIVGHDRDAHAAALVMREALRGAGVKVRWCRLKPGAELARQSAEGGVAVYADPMGSDAGPLVAALKAVGFPAALMPANRAEAGLPSPSLYFAAAGQTAAVADLQTCNPVVRPAASN
jgi:hypothetical protein